MPTNSKFDRFLWFLCPVFLLVFFLTGSTAIAQQCDLLGAKKGDKALSFNFNGFNIDKFYGGVGGKYWTSNTIVLSGSMNFGFDYSKDKDTSREHDDYLPFESKAKLPLKSKAKSQDMSFTIGLEKHLYACSRISPYWGFNGTINYKHETTTEPELTGYSSHYEDGTYTYITKYISRHEKKSISFASGIMFGIEYWVLKNISLTGQYVFYGRYSITTEEEEEYTVYTENDIDHDTTVTKEKEEKKGFDIGFDAVSLILSIYF